MFEKAKQVKVTEHLENGPYIFGGVLIGDKIIAMDNGAILDANADWIEYEEMSWWANLSKETLDR